MSDLLISHIIIALSSVIFSGYLYFSPSKAKLRASYGLVGMTLATGTYLVITTHSSLPSSCETGLIYLGIVAVEIFSARQKLARILVRSE